MICFIFSIIYLSKKKVGYWRYFIWFMLFTVVSEITGHVLTVFFQKNNHWIYNIYLPVETVFICWLFYKICIPYFNSKPWLIVWLTVFFSLYLYQSIKTDFLEFSWISNSASSVFFVFFSCLYYYQLLKHEEYLNLLTFPTFWIVNGIFFFHFGSTSSNLFFDYLVSINLKSAIPIRYIIYIILNFILYGCWSYGFLCKYRQTISS